MTRPDQFLLDSCKQFVPGRLGLLVPHEYSSNVPPQTHRSHYDPGDGCDVAILVMAAVGACAIDGNYRHGARTRETLELWKLIKSLR